MTVADVLAALSQLAWPLLAGVVLWRVCPAVVRVISSRGFTIEVGGSKLTVQEASDLLRMQVYDLQEHVTVLRRSNGNGTLSPVWSRIDSGSACLPRVVWVDPEPSRAAHEAGVLRSNGLDVLQVKDPDQALAVLTEATGANLIVVSYIGTSPSEGKARNLVESVRRIAQRSAGHPIIVYADPSTVEQRREEFLHAGASATIHSPIDLYESLDVAPQAATTEFEWKGGPQ